MDPQVLVVIFIAVALIFDFLNGFHDSANIVATIIASGAMSPRSALLLASLFELAGPFVLGVAVATTVGKDIISPKAISIGVLFAALLSAIIWDLFTWYFGLPTSSSHALLGGLIGAVIGGGNLKDIQLAGLEKAVTALFTAPLLGMAAGWLTMKIVFFLARGASPKINRFFKRAQIITAGCLALSHGSNDAQKTMGVITASLVILGFQQDFMVQSWVILLCAIALSLGIATGGWRIIRTLGRGMFRIRPVHGFAAQATSAGVIIAAALLGGPVSTTQVVGSAIIGVGSAERLSKVRWGVAQNILLAWLMTIPAVTLLAIAIYRLTSYFVR